MESIIINIRTQEEFLTLIPRLGSMGYRRLHGRGEERPISIDDIPWGTHESNICIRLCGSRVYYDKKEFYQRDYPQHSILSVPEYYSSHDREMLGPTLNNNLIRAVYKVMDESLQNPNRKQGKI
jgi:hypothetical protein